MEFNSGIDATALARALAWAEDAYESCDVCPETCQVNRHQSEFGKCGLGAHGRVYKEYLHLGEEALLCPSHTIYLTGCNFRCAFCSDAREVKTPQAVGATVAPETLAKRIALRREQGAKNVNFVGGLPDVNVLYILRTLKHCPSDTHVVWNTNLWTTPTAISHLRGVVGTWLVDFKFGSDHCARKLSGTAHYVETLTRLISLLEPPANLIVRHLLMPGHLECCTRPVLEWMAANQPDTLVNLMTGYHPYALSGRDDPMGRTLHRSEREEGIKMLNEYGINGLVDGRGNSVHRL